VEASISGTLQFLAGVENKYLLILWNDNDSSACAIYFDFPEIPFVAFLIFLKL
jgi:hypothetical protein